MFRRRAHDQPEGAPAGTRYLLREEDAHLRRRLLDRERPRRADLPGRRQGAADARHRGDQGRQGPRAPQAPEGELAVEGNLLDHEYQISRDGIPVANISKRWFRVRDAYGVAVVPGQDDALVLAVTVCIDHLTHHDR